MCGIIGYIGKNPALPILINGLKKLEYRGYDSAGIAVYSNDSITVRKFKGNISNLEEKIKDEEINGNIGIGHTRWATHGEPSDINAHPHTNHEHTIAVIHNGIIENYLELKEFLQYELGISLKSDTDTEIIAHLIDYFWENDLLTTLYKVTEKLNGAYALGVISKHDPNKLIAVRKDSPLIVGVGENENFIASDIPAVLKYTSNVLLIENNEFVEITRDSVKIYDIEKNEVERNPIKVDWSYESSEKEGFEHFTLKEIHEQPKVLRTLLHSNIKNWNLNVKNIDITKEELEGFDKIYIIGCGTAYNAGLIGKRILKHFTGIDAICNISSEFRYDEPTITKNTLVICISQSGETLDTLKSLRFAKEKGAKILSIVNILGSSITRESDYIFYTLGGPEIGVASTKIFTCQILSFCLLSLHFSKILSHNSDDQIKSYLDELLCIPEKIEQILKKSDDIKEISSKHINEDKVLFIGRNMDMDIAYESSLKLKEISYINSFAIGAGELKHGTIALIDDKTFVIALSTQNKLQNKMIANIKEVKSRGANVLCIVQEESTFMENCCDNVFTIPDTFDIFTPMLSIIPMQLLAYYVSYLKGNNVDMPRNLAKSVTVE